MAESEGFDRSSSLGSGELDVELNNYQCLEPINLRRAGVHAASKYDHGYGVWGDAALGPVGKLDSGTLEFSIVEAEILKSFPRRRKDLLPDEVLEALNYRSTKALDTPTLTVYVTLQYAELAHELLELLGKEGNQRVKNAMRRAAKNAIEESFSRNTVYTISPEVARGAANSVPFEESSQASGGVEADDLRSRFELGLRRTRFSSPLASSKLADCKPAVTACTKTNASDVCDPTRSFLVYAPTWHGAELGNESVMRANEDKYVLKTQVISSTEAVPVIALKLFSTSHTDADMHSGDQLLAMCYLDTPEIANFASPLNRMSKPLQPVATYELVPTSGGNSTKREGSLKFDTVPKLISHLQSIHPSLASSDIEGAAAACSLSNGEAQYIDENWKVRLVTENCSGGHVSLVSLFVPFEVNRATLSASGHPHSLIDAMLQSKGGSGVSPYDMFGTPVMRVKYNPSVETVRRLADGTVPTQEQFQILDEADIRKNEKLTELLGKESMKRWKTFMVSNLIPNGKEQWEQIEAVTGSSAGMVMDGQEEAPAFPRFLVEVWVEDDFCGELLLPTPDDQQTDFYTRQIHKLCTYPGQSEEGGSVTRYSRRKELSNPAKSTGWLGLKACWRRVAADQMRLNVQVREARNISTKSKSLEDCLPGRPQVLVYMKHPSYDTWEKVLEFTAFHNVSYLLDAEDAKNIMGKVWRWDRNVMKEEEPLWKNYFCWDEPGRFVTEEREIPMLLPRERSFKTVARFNEASLDSEKAKHLWRLCKAGVPPVLRPYIWGELSGAQWLKEECDRQYRELVVPSIPPNRIAENAFEHVVANADSRFLTSFAQIEEDIRELKCRKSISDYSLVNNIGKVLKALVVFSSCSSNRSSKSSKGATRADTRSHSATPHNASRRESKASNVSLNSSPGSRIALQKSGSFSRSGSAMPHQEARDFADAPQAAADFEPSGDVLDFTCERGSANVGGPVAYCRALTHICYYLLAPDFEGRRFTPEEAFYVLYSLAGATKPASAPLKEYFALYPFEQDGRIRPSFADDIPVAVQDALYLKSAFEIMHPRKTVEIEKSGFKFEEFFYSAFTNMFAGFLPSQSLYRLWDMIFSAIVPPDELAEHSVSYSEVQEIAKSLATADDEGSPQQKKSLCGPAAMCSPCRPDAATEQTVSFIDRENAAAATFGKQAARKLMVAFAYGLLDDVAAELPADPTLKEVEESLRSALVAIRNPATVVHVINKGDFHLFSSSSNSHHIGELWKSYLRSKRAQLQLHGKGNKMLQNVIFPEYEERGHKVPSQIAVVFNKNSTGPHDLYATVPAKPGIATEDLKKTMYPMLKYQALYAPVQLRALPRIVIKVDEIACAGRLLNTRPICRVQFGGQEQAAQSTEFATSTRFIWQDNNVFFFTIITPPPYTINVSVMDEGGHQIAALKNGVFIKKQLSQGETFREFTGDEIVSPFESTLHLSWYMYTNTKDMFMPKVNNRELLEDKRFEAGKGLWGDATGFHPMFTDVSPERFTRALQSELDPRAGRRLGLKADVGATSPTTAATEPGGSKTNGVKKTSLFNFSNSGLKRSNSIPPRPLQPTSSALRRPPSEFGVTKAMLDELLFYSIPSLIPFTEQIITNFGGLSESEKNNFEVVMNTEVALREVVAAIILTSRGTVVDRADLLFDLFGHFDSDRPHKGKFLTAYDMDPYSIGPDAAQAGSRLSNYLPEGAVASISKDKSVKPNCISLAECTALLQTTLLRNMIHVDNYDAYQLACQVFAPGKVVPRIIGAALIPDSANDNASEKSGLDETPKVKLWDRMFRRQNSTRFGAKKTSNPEGEDLLIPVLRFAARDCGETGLYGLNFTRHSNISCLNIKDPYPGESKKLHIAISPGGTYDNVDVVTIDVDENGDFDSAAGGNYEVVRTEQDMPQHLRKLGSISRKRMDITADHPLVRGCYVCNLHDIVLDKFAFINKFVASDLLTEPMRRACSIDRVPNPRKELKLDVKLDVPFDNKVLMNASPLRGDDYNFDLDEFGGSKRHHGHPSDLSQQRSFQPVAVHAAPPPKLRRRFRRVALHEAPPAQSGAASRQANREVPAFVELKVIGANMHMAEKKMNLYVVVTLGDQRDQTDVLKDTVRNAEWNQNFMLFYTGRKLAFEVRDDSSKGAIVGNCEVDLQKPIEQWRSSGKTCPVQAELKHASGEAAGRLDLSIGFVDAPPNLSAATHVEVSIEDVNLPNQRESAISRGVYFTVSLGNQTIFDGPCPIGGNAISRDYEGERLMRFELYDPKRAVRDDVIGATGLDLWPFVRAGKRSIQGSLPLYHKSGKQAGTLGVNIKLFSQPSGPFPPCINVKAVSASFYSDSKTEPYISMGLGSQRAATPVVKGGGEPVMFSYDAYLNYSGEKECEFELYEKDSTSPRDLVGRGSANIWTMLRQNERSAAIPVTLYKEGKKTGVINTIIKLYDRPTGTIPPLCNVNVHQGVDLGGSTLLDTIDPYVTLTFNDRDVQQTPAIPHGGAHPIWNSKLTLKYTGDRFLKVKVKDEEVFRDSHVGEGVVDVWLMMHESKESPTPVSVPIFRNKRQQGAVNLGVEFFDQPPRAVPEGLRVLVRQGRDLKGSDFAGRIDPYVKVKLGSSSAKTYTIADGGPNVSFNDQQLFVDHDGGDDETVVFEVWDEDSKRNKDDIIGVGQMNLWSMFKNAAKPHPATVQLINPKNGKFAGSLRVVCELVYKMAVAVGFGTETEGFRHEHNVSVFEDDTILTFKHKVNEACHQVGRSLGSDPTGVVYANVNLDSRHKIVIDNTELDEHKSFIDYPRLGLGAYSASGRNFPSQITVVGDKDAVMALDGPDREVAAMSLPPEVDLSQHPEYITMMPPSQTKRFRDQTADAFPSLQSYGLREKSAAQEEPAETPYTTNTRDVVFKGEENAPAANIGYVKKDCNALKTAAKQTHNKRLSKRKDEYVLAVLLPPSNVTPISYRAVKDGREDPTQKPVEVEDVNRDFQLCFPRFFDPNTGISRRDSRRSSQESSFESRGDWETRPQGVASAGGPATEQEGYLPRDVYVYVHKAANLKGTRKSDPYVKILLGKDKKKTKAKPSAGANAVYNELFHFPYDQEEKKLKLEVWDDDFLKDDYLGSTSIDLKRLARSGVKETTDEHQLYSSKGLDAGKVMVTISFDNAPSLAKQQPSEAPPVTEIPPTKMESFLSSSSSVSMRSSVSSAPVRPSFQEEIVVNDTSRDLQDEPISPAHEKPNMQLSILAKDAFGLRMRGMSRVVLRHGTDAVSQPAPVQNGEAVYNDVLSLKRLPGAQDALLGVQDHGGNFVGTTVLNLDALSKLDLPVDMRKDLADESGAHAGCINYSLDIHPVGKEPRLECRPAAARTPRALSFLIVDAVDLPSHDVSHKQDPYCLVKFGDASQRTCVCKRGGAHPVWKEVVEVPYDSNAQSVTFAVLDADHVTSDDFIGQCNVDVKKVLRAQEIDGGLARYQIFDKKGKPAGYINMRISCLQHGDGKVGAPGEAPHSVVFLARNAVNLPGGKIGKRDPYVKVVTGLKTTKTKPHKNGGANPVWEQSLDLEVPRRDSGSKFEVQVWDDDVTVDDLIGKCTVDLNAIDNNNQWGRALQAKLTDKKGGDAGTLNYKVDRAGVPSTVADRGVDILNKKQMDGSAKQLYVTVLNAVDLPSHDRFSAQDPYVKVILDKATKSKRGRTRTIKKGGAAPIWKETVPLDHDKEDSLRLEVHDDDPLRDDFIGAAMVYNLKHMRESEPTCVKKLPLQDKKGKPAGFLNCRLDFRGQPTESEIERSMKEVAALAPDTRSTVAPPSKVWVTLLKGEKLIEKDKHSKQDPYVKVTVGSRHQKSKTHKLGGSEPVWNQTLEFPYNGEEAIRLEAYDEDHLGDDFIGSCAYDVGSLVRSGKKNEEVRKPIVTKKGEAAGFLHYIVDLEQPSAAHASRDLGAAQAPDFKPQNLVYLTIQEAEDLGAGETSAAKWDTYVNPVLGNNVKKTRVIKNSGPNPVWNEVIDLSYQREPTMRLEVWDKDLLSRDDYIGACDVDMWSFMSSGDDTIEVRRAPLVNKKGKRSGYLNYKLSRSPPTSAERDGVPIWFLFRNGEGLPKHDTLREQDPYVKVLLGVEKQKNPPKTEAHKRGGAAPVWNEAVEVKYKGEEKCKLEVWDDDLFVDDFIGACNVPIESIVKAGRPYVKREALMSKKGKPAGFLNYEVHFTKPSAATIGGTAGTLGESHKPPKLPSRLYVTCRDASGLPSHDHLRKQDPYLQVKFLSEKKVKARTKTIKKGGDTAVWNELLEVDYPGDQYVHLEVMDDDVLRDDFIGTCAVDVWDLINRGQSEWNGVAQLRDKKGAPAGLLNVGVRTSKPREDGLGSPSAAAASGPQEHVLMIDCLDATGLPDKDHLSKMDPYVKAFVGQSKKPVGKTKKHKKGGSNPEWNETIKVPCTVADGVVRLEVWDDDIMFDDFVGKAELNIADHAGRGRFEGTLPLKDKKGNSAGYLNCAVADISNYATTREAEPSLKSPNVADRSVPEKFYLVCANASGLPSHDRFHKQDPYVKAFIGSAKKAAAKTKTCKKGGAAPVWNETLPLELSNERTLRVEVWDDDVLSDDLIGRAELDVPSLLEKHGNRFTGSVPLVDKKGNKAGYLNCGFSSSLAEANEIRRELGASESGSPGDTTPAADAARPDAWTPKPQKLYVKCLNAAELPSHDRLKKQDPYVKVFLGDAKKPAAKTKTCKKGGSAPVWNETLEAACNGESIMRLEVWDDDFMNDDFIGAGKLEVSEVMARGGVFDGTVQLTDKKGNPAGKLNVAVAQDPGALKSAGKTPQSLGMPVAASDKAGPETLFVRCANAIGLPSHDRLRKQDPYVKVFYGDAKKPVARSKTCSKGGAEPVWNETLEAVRPDGERLMRVEVWDDDVMIDDLIGRATLDLEHALRGGVFDGSLPLQDKKGNPAGTLNLAVAKSSEALGALPMQKGAREEPRVVPRDAAAQEEEPAAEQTTLYVTCSNAVDLPSHDHLKKQDPYVKVFFGDAKKPTAQTKTCKKGGSAPVWNEVLKAVRPNGERSMRLEVWDADVLRDDLIGFGTLDIDDIMRSGGAYNGKLPLKDRKGQAAGFLNCGLGVSPQAVAQGSASPPSHAAREVAREAPRQLPSTLFLTCINGEDLPDHDRLHKQDPYVTAYFGSAKKHAARTKTHKKGGSSPVWNETLEIDYSQGEEKLNVEVWDDDVMRDDLIGKAELNVWDVVEKYGGTHKDTIHLHDKKGRPAGYLNYHIATQRPAVKAPPSVASTPASKAPEQLDEPTTLYVNCANAVDLPSHDHFRQQDPYVKLFIDDAKKPTVKSKTINKGGSAPVWNETLQATCPGGTRSLRLEVWDADVLVDDLIGSATVDVASIVQSGKVFSGSLPLKDKKGNPAGFLNCSVGTSPQQLTPAKPAPPSAAREVLREAPGQVPPTVYLTCINGEQLPDHDRLHKQDPYVLAYFGSSKKGAPRTKTHKRAGSSPVWNETLALDCSDPEEKLTVEVWDEDKLRDDLIGKGELNVWDLLERHDGHKGRLDLQDKKGKSAGYLNYQIGTQPPSAKTPQSTVASTAAGRAPELSGTPTTVHVRCSNAVGLPSHDRLREQDPYVKVFVDDAKKPICKTKTCNKGGSAPVWNETLEVPCDTKSRKLRFEVWDSDMINDDLIGAGNVQLSQILSTGKPFSGELPLTDQKGRSAGKLNCTVSVDEPVVVSDRSPMDAEPSSPKATTKSPPQNLPDKLYLKCINGKDLPEHDHFKKQDPYVKAQLLNGETKRTYRTSKAAKGGSSPVWDETLALDYSGKEAKMSVEVWDADMLRDDFIGKAELDVWEVFTLHGGNYSGLLALTDKKGKPAGFLNCSLSGAAPVTSKPPSVSRSPQGMATSPRTVYLTCENAVELPSHDRTRKQDPYVKVFVDQAKKPIARTKTCNRGGSKPVWNETLEVPCAENSRLLRLEVFDEDKIKDDFIGSCDLDLQAIVAQFNGEFGGRMTLVDKSGTSAGYLNCKVSTSPPYGVPVTPPVAAPDDAAPEIHSPPPAGLPDKFYVTCTNAVNLKNHDKMGRQDPYVKVFIGDSTQAITKTKTHKDGGLNPEWKETLEVAYKDKTLKKLRLEVYDEDWVKDDFIGKGELDLHDIFTRYNGTFADELLLHDKKGREAGVLNAGVSASPEAFPDHVASPTRRPVNPPSRIYMTFKNGTRLAEKDTLSTQDPYVKVFRGLEKKPIAKTKTHKKGGAEPVWNETLELDYSDAPRILRVEVWDADVLSKDDFIGRHEFNVWTFLEKGKTPIEEKMALLDANGEAAGFVNCTIATDRSVPSETHSPTPAKRPAPAKLPDKLYVTCKNGVDLPNHDVMRKQDPYVKIFVGDHSEADAKTKTHKKGGSSPEWNETLEVEYTDKAEKLRFEVFDADKVTKDDFVGKGEINIWDVVEVLGGEFESSLPLVDKKGKPAGHLNVAVSTKKHGKSTASSPAAAASPPSPVSPTVKPKQLYVLVKNGEGLATKDKKNKPADPYVKVFVNGNKKPEGKTKKIKEGGANPVWKETVACKYPTKKEELRLEAWDSHFIGAGEVNLDKARQRGKQWDGTVRLVDKKGQASGKINCSVGFDAKPVASSSKSGKSPKEASAPSSTNRSVGAAADAPAASTKAPPDTLWITVVAAKELMRHDVKKNDPYVVVQVGSKKFETTVKKDAGEAASWHETFSLSGYKSSDVVEFRVMDKDRVSKDDLIGTCVVPISDVIAAGPAGIKDGQRIRDDERRDGGRLDYVLRIGPKV